MTDAIIRPLTEDDIPAVCRLLNGVAEFAVARDDRWSAPELVKWVSTEPALCAAAVSEGCIVGVCLTHLHLATGKLHVENIVVSPSLRRRGIATRMLQEIARAAGNLALANIRMVALVKVGNSGARAFFDSVGLAAGEDVTWYQRTIPISRR